MCLPGCERAAHARSSALQLPLPSASLPLAVHYDARPPASVCALTVPPPSRRPFSPQHLSPAPSHSVTLVTVCG
eukprot:66230-Chlamydomonas_euryale.AAC.1